MTIKTTLLLAAALLFDTFDLQAHAALSNTATVFDINSPYNQMTRYLRRAKSGPTAAAIDLTVTPTFNSLGTVAGTAAVASGTGGTLATQTASYRVTALNANGETLAAAAATAAVTGPTGSVTVTWTAKTGATGYNIYGRTGGSESLLATVGAVTTWTDTGANTPQGTGYTVPTVDSTGTIQGAIAGQVNAGDMVYRTANGGIASLNTPGTANANAASFLGVSEENYPLNIGLGEGINLTRPMNDTTSVSVAIRQSGEFKFKTTPGDVYNPGDAVYLGADAQTVQKTASGSIVGRVCNDQNPVGGGDFSASITGAAGQEVVIEITPAAAY